MEFAHFHGISMFSRNFAEFGTGKYGIFWSVSGSPGQLITICRYDCAMKYATATQAVMGH